MKNFYFRSKMLIIMIIGTFAITGCSMYPAITPVDSVHHVIKDAHNIANTEVEHSKGQIQIIGENLAIDNREQEEIKQIDLNKSDETNKENKQPIPEEPLKSNSELLVDFDKNPIVNISDVADEQSEDEEKTEEKPEDQATPDADVQKVIALTFDDGPDAKYTPQVLDILKEKNIKATFFIVGIQIKKYPEIVQRMVDEGHLIANHTYNHPNLKKLTKAQILNELDTTDELIKSVVGFEPTIVRPPYGSINDEVRAIIEETGREVILWNIDTRDWADTPVNDMYNNVMTNARDGGNILFHSFGGKQIQNTVEVLPKVIDSLLEQDYTFVTVDHYINQE